MTKADKHLSVNGTCCPVPLVKLSQAMNELNTGQILSITGDDPVFEVGVTDYCQANGYEILDITNQTGREVNIVIKK